MFRLRDPILEGEQSDGAHLAIRAAGVDQPWHIECFFRHIMGGLNHMKGTWLVLWRH